LTDTTAIGGEDLAEEPIRVSVYPNPAGDFVNFRLAGYSGRGDSKIFLYSMVGRVIREITVPGEQPGISIPVSNLPGGSYFFVLTNPDFTRSGKIMIVR
jgi:hypothetical protein